MYLFSTLFLFEYVCMLQINVVLQFRCYASCASAWSNLKIFGNLTKVKEKAWQV